MSQEILGDPWLLLLTSKVKGFTAEWTAFSSLNQRRVKREVVLSGTQLLSTYLLTQMEAMSSSTMKHWAWHS